MKLVVLSHKECWHAPESPTGHATIGGFPFHMEAIAALFDETQVVVLRRETPKPQAAAPLAGHNMNVDSLPEPAGKDLRRKLALLTWFPRHFRKLWRVLREADAVHAPVPGDLGTIAILLALAQGKPLFVRHCGTWGEPVTVADRFLLWLLERVAGGTTVVLATGGGDSPPSGVNSSIDWIFSSSLKEEEIRSLQPAKPWQPGGTLRLITVSRMDASKNTQAIVEALPRIKEVQPEVHLSVVGGGRMLPRLKELAAASGVADAVTFHGYVSHDRVLELLADSHIFVFPTQVKEGFPKAVLEALAVGVPVVATGVSVLPSLIGDENGLVLERTDASATAEAVLQLIAHPERLAEMAASARATSLSYTLEAWQAQIGRRLEAEWGPLQAQPGQEEGRAE